MVQAMFTRHALVPWLMPLCLLAACNKSRQDTAAAVPAQAPSSAASSARPEVVAVPSCVPKEGPKAAGAPNDSREGLMREVFPGWTEQHGCVLLESDDESEGAGGPPALVHPHVVMSFGADRRVLVVSEEPSDERGVTTAAHAEPGKLASYGFTLRDGHWFVSHETQSIATIGYFGIVGDVQRVELGRGHPGLTVTHGSCWQGYCGRWMSWYELDADGELLHSGDIGMLTSNSTGAKINCESWLKPASAPPAASAPEDIDENCFDVSGTVRIVPVPDQPWSDFVVDFTGTDTVVDPKTQVPSPRAIRETAVWRRQGDTYELVRGRNPTHAF
jgi:hypothetical protein